MWLVSVWKAVLRQLVILCLTSFIMCSCLVSISFCPFFLLLRSFVSIMAKYTRKDLDKLVPPAKVLFAYDSVTKKPKLNLAGFFILDEKPDLDNIRSLASQRIIHKVKSKTNVKGQGDPDPNNNIVDSDSPFIENEKESELLYPELRQTWTSFGGYFFWKWDPNFHINNHIRMYDYEKEFPLPMGAGAVCNESHLQSVFGSLLEKPWKKGRSPWEILFIGSFKSIHEENESNERMSEANQYVVAFRIHHAIGDGYSFLKVLQDAANVDMTNRKINFPQYSKWEMVLGAMFFPLKFPYDVASNLVDSYDGPNSWHLVDTKLCREYNSCISKPFPMELIKRIKNKHGVSYNAVLCAATGGAFCKLMKDNGQKVPQKVSCMFPFPLPNHPGGLVLHAASVFIKWPMGKAPSSLERLRKINDEIRKSKFYTGHLFYSAVSLFLGVAPKIVTRVSRNKICSTLGVSCLPGPDQPLDFLGAKMRDVIVGAGAAAGKIAGTMVLLSICGKQRFVANIDKTVFPSAQLFQRLGDYVEEELKVMLLAGDSISSDFIV